ncbi:hypothetical protein J1N35_011992 [Gossypium stocksii]|uniref:Uncharacterized protein n=1 Tax=Gossypium stocksii TaxID=47602 RepID=A0A9D4ADU4_9ROSI|nr:hypothetical protein J1N35_011992 [Gossypium stocksii]
MVLDKGTLSIELRKSVKGGFSFRQADLSISGAFAKTPLKIIALAALRFCENVAIESKHGIDGANRRSYNGTLDDKLAKDYLKKLRAPKTEPLKKAEIMKSVVKKCTAMAGGKAVKCSRCEYLNGTVKKAPKMIGMRLTSPSPVYRGILAMFLAGSRQVSGKVLKQHQERRLQQLLPKRQIVMV